MYFQMQPLSGKHAGETVTGGQACGPLPSTAQQAFWAAHLPPMERQAEVTGMASHSLLLRNESKMQRLGAGFLLDLGIYFKKKVSHSPGWPQVHSLCSPGQP